MTISHQMPSYNTKLDKAMSQEQLNQIVEAILAGKYSWACVLILRFAGYNPLHYIPYRTYNRLLKDNCQVGRGSTNKADSINNDQKVPSLSKNPSSQGCLSQINDLAYLEVMGKQQAHVRGGDCPFWSEWTPEDSSPEKQWLTIAQEFYNGKW
ncbi:HetP family heterocyst commitment protein [Microseira sp. BLCC-F43]|uniref:HetP family heterocyst commitment protein n=1 Tax=Microseira sp. BLCC-F43 TaxID=3153602 RepID=UPI0035BB1209